jgi:hypothetical protein
MKPMASTLRLPGAKTDLGLDVTWRYSFVPASQTVDQLGDTVFIDVGGRLEHGIIDHHCAASDFRSSARLVVDHPAYVYEHLVGPWVSADRVASVKGRQWSPTLVTHESPDFDSLVATKLVQSLVETGQFPGGCEELCRYADRVDSGFQRLQLPEKRFELYPLILMLQNILHDRREELAAHLKLLPQPGQPRFCRHELMLRLGLHLVDAWLAAGGGKSDSASTGFQEDVLVRELANEIEKDADHFRAAVARYRAIGDISVPSSSGRPLSLSAAALIACQCDQVPCVCKSPWHAFDKMYLRSGFPDSSPAISATPLTVIEKPRKTDEKPTVGRPAVARHRWIVSIDPHVESGQPRPSLEGLGASLEWAEQAKRQKVPGGSDTRKDAGSTRFSEYPGVSDPWYDGRGHQWTIVDSPIDGSVLTVDEVIGILSESFWDPLLEGGVAWAWRWQAGSIERAGCITRNDLTSPSRGGASRVAQFLGHASREACGDYIVAVVRVRSGWAAARFVEAIRDVVSGDPQPTQFVCGAAYVGPHGTVVTVHSGMAAYEPGESITVLLKLHHELLDIEKHAASLTRTPGASADSDSGAACQLLRKRFIQSVTEYRGSRATETPDDRTLRIALEEILRIDKRCDGTGELLQLLDDEAQEISEWRLNRLGLILAIMGVLQTIIAAFEAIESVYGASFPVGPFSFHAVWASVTFALTAGCALFALSMASQSFQKMYARFGIMRQFFPEHAVNPLSRRRRAEEGD